MNAFNANPFRENDARRRETVRAAQTYEDMVRTRPMKPPPYTFDKVQRRPGELALIHDTRTGAYTP